MGTCAEQNSPEKETDAGCGCMFMSNCRVLRSCPHLQQEAGTLYACMSQWLSKVPRGLWPIVKETLLPRNSCSRGFSCWSPAAEDMGMLALHKGPKMETRVSSRKKLCAGRFPSEIGGCRVPKCREELSLD